MIGIGSINFLKYFLYFLFQRRAILNNPDVINSNESWSKLFYNDFWGTNISDPGSHCSYRPLTVLTFKVNYNFLTSLRLNDF